MPGKARIEWLEEIGVGSTEIELGYGSMDWCLVMCRNPVDETRGRRLAVIT